MQKRNHIVVSKFVTSRNTDNPRLRVYVSNEQSHRLEWGVTHKKRDSRWASFWNFVFISVRTARCDDHPL